MAYTTTRIGMINEGIDGSDEYLMVRSTDDALDLPAVEQELTDLYYRESTRPGGYFCHTVRLIPDPIHDNTAIAIVQHRYDV